MCSRFIVKSCNRIPSKQSPHDAHLSVCHSFPRVAGAWACLGQAPFSVCSAKVKRKQMELSSSNEPSRDLRHLENSNSAVILTLTSAHPLAACGPAQRSQRTCTISRISPWGSCHSLHGPASRQPRAIGTKPLAYSYAPLLAPATRVGCSLAEHRQNST